MGRESDINRHLLIVTVAVLAAGWAGGCASRQPTRMEWITVAEDGKGFAGAATGAKFVPWGFNYDRDYRKRLLEDYWDAEWSTVAEDFREMKTLGANVVRIHLQVARFMESPDRPNPAALAQLGRLVALAEETGLYLDLTGLGCYRRGDTPPWYDALAEGARWDVQARFWEAVAGVCADSPAVFCYDLMNEPVVPSGRREAGAWLAGEFGGFSYVQFISLDQGDRPRPAIARQWVAKLAAAIRRRDPRRLVTVGLLPDAHGNSGFVPSEVAPELDFLCVHVYPERGKLNESLETVKGFQVGKPLVVEETFPLRCGAEDLEQFMRDADAYVAGWVGFYWGQTPADLAPSPEIGDALTRAWLDLFQRGRPGAAPR